MFAMQVYLWVIVTRGTARGCEGKQQTENIMGDTDVPLAQKHYTDVGSDHSATLRLLHKISTRLD